MFQYQLKLATRNKLVIFCLLLGFLLGITGILDYLSIARWGAHFGEMEKVSCYVAWLNALALGSGAMYKVFVPLLIIPNLDSYLIERKNGYSIFAISRSSYSRYFFSKLFSGIITACSILVIVLLSWLLICVIAYPKNMPYSDFVYITDVSQHQLFVEHPVVYIGVVFGFNILFAMIFYALGFGMSAFCKNRYIVMVIPFLIYLAFTELGALTRLSLLMPVALVTPFEIITVSWNEIFLEFLCWGVVAVIAVVGDYINQKRKFN